MLNGGSSIDSGDCPNNSWVDHALSDMRGYNRSKLALADQLRNLRENLTLLGLAEVERQIAELVERLAHDRFRIAVVGHRQQYAYALMNSIVGQNILPIDDLIISPVAIEFKYGDREQFLTCYTNGNLPEKQPVTSFASYMAQTNGGSGHEVERIVFELPLAVLEPGLELVIAPEASLTGDSTSLAPLNNLEQYDSAILLANIDSLPSVNALTQLPKNREFLKGLFFVVNRSSNYSDSQTECAIGRFRETLQSYLNLSTPAIYRVQTMSDQKGQYGFNSQNTNNGLDELMKAIVTFVTLEKRSVFLAGIASRALSMVSGASGAVVEAGSTNRGQAPATGNTLDRNPDRAARAIRDASFKIEAILNSFGHDGKPVDGGSAPQIPNFQNTDCERDYSGKHYIPPEIDIPTDLQSQGCPVCNHLHNTARGYLINMQYQLRYDANARATFAGGMGLCARHTWQLFAISSSFGISVGFPLLAKSIANSLRSINANPQGVDLIRPLIHGPQTCPLCRLISHAESEYIEALATFVEEPEGKDQYNGSQGVCLLHLNYLLNKLSDQLDRQYVLNCAARQFDNDADAMQSYALKQEALCRQAITKQEENACLRVINRLAGGREF